MESIYFFHNGIYYRLELNRNNNNEVKIFKHIFRDQKELMVEIFGTVINNNGNHGLNARITNYIQRGCTDDSVNTHELGRNLFDYLQRNNITTI